MKRLIISLFVFAVVLSSCTHYKMQFVSLECDKLKKDSTWVYRDSIIEITYFYYNRDGKMTFIINNISDKPIFFDGKNSFILVGSNKYPYWSDVAVINGNNTPGYGSAYNRAHVAINAVEVRQQERMNLIPPNSNIVVSKYFVHDNSLYDLKQYGAKNDTVAVNWKTNSSKKTVIKKANFEKTGSPLAFRNFITLSRTEDVKVPLYYDFSFWASGVWEMDARQATKSKFPETYAEGAYKEGNYPYAEYHPYKKPWIFYLSNIYVGPAQ